MSETLKLLRVFLASPRDLNDERGLVKEAVDEINRRIAPNLGYRVELSRWEDTLPASGRPQAHINEDVDRCELFVGMLWKRWGSPTDPKGPHTSGFEEEFERAISRLKDTQKPDIAMFFKEIGKELTVGIGEDLQKIGEDLAKIKGLQERIRKEQMIYYKEFSEPHELQGYVREKVVDYLFKGWKAEKEDVEEEQSKSKKPIAENEDAQEPVKSPFSAEGHDFLTGFLEKTKAEDSAEIITPFEVARLRLLSSALSKSGNDALFLGVHDANIIYAHKHVGFGPVEISSLIDCGLKNITQENVPLWHWYRLDGENTGQRLLAIKSIAYSEEDVGSGALEAMRLIGAPLPVNTLKLDRKFFIEDWLSETSPDSIKVAALRYLKLHGKDEDLPLIQSELDRADYNTSRIALETIISIQLLYNEREALKTAFKNQFEFFDETLLEKLLSVSLQLDDETLKLGLSHSNKRIRLESFKRLKDKKKLNAEQIQALKNDPFARIRKEIVDYLFSIGQPPSPKDVRDILVKSQRTGGLGGLLSLGAGALTLTDKEGEEFHDDYLSSIFHNLSEEKLLEITKEWSIFDNIPYFALCSRYFKSHSEELRKNVDDQFKSKFEAFIEHEKSMGLNDETIEVSRDLEDFLRRKLTRKALDVLCKKGEEKDLDRIRNNMRTKYVKSSDAEMEYFQKLGKWKDVGFIVRAEKDWASKRTSLINPIDEGWACSVAKALYGVGKNRIDDLLKIEMPAPILVELIKMCSSIDFLKISDGTLLNLLNNKEEAVRKFSALKSAQVFKKPKLKTLLDEYLNGTNNRYYNVVFWLDFGVVMPKSIIGKAFKIIVSE